jgi:integrase
VARGIHRLTQLQLKRASRRGLYADGGGLYLQITKHGSRSWIFRYKRGGRSRMMGLGSLSVVDLREARELALAARKELHAGIDPLAARAGARAVAVKTISFDGATATFLDAHSAAWRNAKHVQQWRNTLSTYASPVLGALPVRDIDTGLVMRVLTPIWQAKPETASRLRGRIEAILGWAAVHGYRAGDSPARWKDHLQRLLPAKGKLRAVRHYAALPYAELPAFLAELRQQASVAARCLEFLILTAARTSEVIKATTAEFDLAAKVWTIPAARMKAGREHRVPLSDRAIELIGVLPHDSAARVFPRSQMALLKLLRRRMKRADITSHGFRSTFRDWAAETTNYPNHVVEQALAHIIGNAVEAAYRRGDLFEKRRRLMDDWAAYCTLPPRTEATVLSLRRVTAGLAYPVAPS